MIWMDEDVEHRKWIRPGIRGCGGDEDGVDRRRCGASKVIHQIKVDTLLM